MSSHSGFYVREVPMPVVEDVKEKYERCGVEALRDQELLCLFLDISAELVELVTEGQPFRGIIDSPRSEVEGFFGTDKARQFLCGIELARRLLHMDLGILPAITCPLDTLPYLESIRRGKKEHFLCLYLNARNQVILNEIVSIGSLSSSIVHPREVFLPAVTNSAASVVLAHNHPSGDTSPSQDDIELTRRLAKAGDLLGIDVIDHIIITEGDFLSIKERGLL